MFKIRKIMHRPWPVTVKQMVCDDAGQVTAVESTFVGHFSAFSEEGLLDLQERVKAAHPDGPDSGQTIAVTLRRNAETFAALLVGWGPEVADEDGQPLPFSTFALSALVNGPDGVAVSTALHVAVNQLRFGVAPEKNAPTSPAPGPTPGAGEAQADGATLNPTPSI